MKNKVRIKLKSIIVLFVIILILYYGYKMLIVEHNFTYNIDKYKIDEHFYIDDGHYYDFIISNKKNTYSFIINKNLNKKKKVITDIKEYKNNNLLCIIPIYKKNIDKNIYCNLDNKQVSIDYLIKSNNDDFKKIKKKIKKYKINLPKSSDKKTKYKKISIYNKNIDDEIYYIWNYKGIYILDNEHNNYKKILNYDLYDSIESCVVGDIFVLFENTKVTGIETIYYYDFSKKKLNKFQLKEKISKDSYINGVVDNLIYVTDRKNKKEYSINITKHKIEEIDEDETNYVVYENGKKKKMSKSDYFMSDKYFENVYLEDSRITSNTELIKSGRYYYYKEDNKIYRVLDSDKKHPTLLFEMNNMKEWKVINEEVVVLVEDTIYSYNDNNGLRPIFENSELKYNYKNIYAIGKK